MKWIDFEREIRAKNIRLFRPFEVKWFFSKSKIATVFFINRLVKQGYIYRVRRGLYKLSNDEVPDLYIANKIYEPSYVSLEFALSYYGVIPETVYEITSVTTKATREFHTMGKVFSYSKIKNTAFTGYEIKKEGEIGFYMADAEKAFVDLFYLRQMRNQKPISRFNKLKIDPAKTLAYAKIFSNQKLLSIIEEALK